mgnify:CR=1 FL=1
MTAAVRLAAFNIPQYAAMTSMDEMDFGSLGERKRAIFCVIPVNDSSMNYLVGMLYTQCFQELYRCADLKYNGRLPVPVRVIQDEWANVAQPESYPKILATCRSYNIGLNIIVQNVQQIKALYEKQNSEMLALLKTIASEMKEPKQHNNKESKGDIKVVAATEIKKESTSAQQPKKERPTIDRSSEEYQRKIKKWNVLKSRGYIEQAVREYMEYTGTEQNEATEFINNL